MLLVFLQNTCALETFYIARKKHKVLLPLVRIIKYIEIDRLCMHTRTHNFTVAHDLAKA